MASPNREQMLNMAIQSAKQGNKQGARMMFRQVLQDDKKNERALLWMAKLADTPAERRKWLDRVLRVNPDNEVARKAVARFETSAERSENKKLVQYGGMAAAGFMLITLLMTAAWAFAPLS